MAHVKGKAMLAKSASKMKDKTNHATCCKFDQNQTNIQKVNDKLQNSCHGHSHFEYLMRF